MSRRCRVACDVCSIALVLRMPMNRVSAMLVQIASNIHGCRRIVWRIQRRPRYQRRCHAVCRGMIEVMRLIRSPPLIVGEFWMLIVGMQNLCDKILSGWQNAIEDAANGKGDDRAILSILLHGSQSGLLGLKQAA